MSWGVVVVTVCSAERSTRFRGQAAVYGAVCRPGDDGPAQDSLWYRWKFINTSSGSLNSLSSQGGQDAVWPSLPPWVQVQQAGDSQVLEGAISFCLSDTWEVDGGRSPASCWSLRLMCLFPNLCSASQYCVALVFRCGSALPQVLIDASAMPSTVQPHGWSTDKYRTVLRPGLSFTSSSSGRCSVCALLAWSRF